MVIGMSLAWSAVLALAPQGGDDPRLRTSLPASRIQALRQLAIRWQQTTAKAALVEALQRPHRGTDILSQVGDLLRIFDKTREYPGERGTSRQVRYETGPFERRRFYLHVPKPYRADAAHRAVLVLPGRPAPRRQFTSPRRTFDTTWATSNLADTIIAVAGPPDDLDLGVRPKRRERDAELRRIEATLRPLFRVMREYRIDRRRIVLDCGPHSCGFGLRLAAMYPTLFAGVILRRPTSPDDGRIPYNLANVAVLLMAEDSTDTETAQLHRQLERINPGTTSVLERSAAGDQLQARIDAWVMPLRRPLFPATVRLAPGTPYPKRSHWVEALEFTDGESKPFVEATANSEFNRIDINARGITKLLLRLNHALVDLDHLVVTVNGKVVDLAYGPYGAEVLLDQLRRLGDPTALYTRLETISIPTRARTPAGVAVFEGWRPPPRPAADAAPTTKTDALRRPPRLRVDMEWKQSDPVRASDDHPEDWNEEQEAAAPRPAPVTPDGPAVQATIEGPGPMPVPDPAVGWRQRLASIEFLLGGLAILVFGIIQLLLWRARRARRARQPLRVATRPDPRSPLAANLD